MSGNINSNSHTKFFLLSDFMDIFQNLDNLRHYNNLFDYFFKDIGNLNEFLFLNHDLNWCLFVSIDNLKDFFDMIYISNDFFKLFNHNCLLNYSFNLFNSLIIVSNLNYFFVFSNNFFDLLYNHRDFNNFLYYILDISVHVD